MWKRILLEASIVAVQTVALIGLCATVGISRSDPKAQANSGRPLGLDLYQPEPADDPATPDKVRLGQPLFRDCLSQKTVRVPTSTAINPGACTDGPKGHLSDGSYWGHLIQRLTVRVAIDPSHRELFCVGISGQAVLCPLLSVEQICNLCQCPLQIDLSEALDPTCTTGLWRR